MAQSHYKLSDKFQDILGDDDDDDDDVELVNFNSSLGWVIPG